MQLWRKSCPGRPCWGRRESDTERCRWCHHLNLRLRVRDDTRIVTSRRLGVVDSYTPQYNMVEDQASAREACHQHTCEPPMGLRHPRLGQCSAIPRNHSRWVSIKYGIRECRTRLFNLPSSDLPRQSWAGYLEPVASEYAKGRPLSIASSCCTLEDLCKTMAIPASCMPYLQPLRPTRHLNLRSCP